MISRRLSILALAAFASILFSPAARAQDVVYTLTNKDKGIKGKVEMESTRGVKAQGVQAQASDRLASGQGPDPAGGAASGGQGLCGGRADLPRAGRGQHRRAAQGKCRSAGRHDRRAGQQVRRCREKPARTD